MFGNPRKTLALFYEILHNDSLDIWTLMHALIKNLFQLLRTLQNWTCNIREAPIYSKHTRVDAYVCVIQNHFCKH